MISTELVWTCLRICRHSKIKKIGQISWLSSQYQFLNSWFMKVNEKTFRNSKGLSGSSPLGYISYSSNGMNSNQTYFSIYDSQPTQFTNWASGQPNLVMPNVAVQNSQSNWVTVNTSTNPLTPVCQQGLVYGKIGK